MKYLIRVGLSIISIPIVSRLYGWLTRRKHPRFIIKKIIRIFAKTYKIDMREYEGEFEDYASLSDFFIRRIDYNVRKIEKLEKDFVSPADGFLTNLETIYKDGAVQAKGRRYKLSEFLQRDIDFSEGWHIATVYLSPHDYHRFHHTIDAEVVSYCHKKGSLFPVNKFGTTLVKELFNRNERIITKYRLNGSDFFVVAVGATFVGSIKMEFIEKHKRDNEWKKVNLKIEQLDEMGRFEMGSTIIIAVPKKIASPYDNISGKPIRLGDPIFKLL